MHVLRGVVRKLKVTPGSPVPFCDGQIVLINSIQQAAPGRQKGIFSDAVLK